MTDARLIKAKEELEAKGYDTDGICLGNVGGKVLTHYVKLKDFVTIPESDVPAGFNMVYHVEYYDDGARYYLSKTDPSEENYVEFFAMIFPD